MIAVCVAVFVASAGYAIACWLKLRRDPHARTALLAPDATRAPEHITDAASRWRRFWLANALGAAAVGLAIWLAQ